MKIKQQVFRKGTWQTKSEHSSFVAKDAELVLVFGAKDSLSSCDISELKAAYSNAKFVTCSTAGEVYGSEILEDSVTATAVSFEKTRVVCTETNIKEHKTSFDLGANLMKSVNKEDLTFVFVISDGSLINGSDLVEGLESQNSSKVLISGGLAGDGANFVSTLTGLDENIGHGNVVLIGFYGQDLKVGNGSLGGWDEFGHERTVTRSDKNVLYELDGKSALALYKEYLGPYADELPGSALLFPLSLKIESEDSRKVRTILSVNEADSSMTFAGNIPEGSKVRLMKANFDKLIEAAANAAISAKEEIDCNSELAILVSCVGRKLVLNERTEEELEKAREVFGKETVMTGFYSYGEISPDVKKGHCQLLNQTMTITCLSEN